MDMKSVHIFLLIISNFLMAGCQKSGNSVDVGAHKKQIEEWQSKRLARLKGDQGWLTLCGLFWLKEGENKMGTDSSNRIIFPPNKAPAYAGSLWLEKGVVRLEAPKNSEIKVKDSVVNTMGMISDGDGYSDPTILNLRMLTFQIIKRGDQFG